MITKKYSQVDNIIINGGNLSFEVTANDGFVVDKILYTNTYRIRENLEEVDLADYLTNGEVKLCLDSDGQDCNFDKSYPQGDFEDELHFFTVITNEIITLEDCDYCNGDVYVILNEDSEYKIITDHILKTNTNCSCVSLDECDVERFILLQLILADYSEVPVMELAEIYDQYKEICCEQDA